MRFDKTSKKCNFSEMEIEMFFAKYDTDGDGVFSWEEGAQIVEDLENDKIDQNRPVSGKRPGSSRPVSGALEHQRINHEEFSMLTGRVDRMEGVIGSIVSKIDTVLINHEEFSMLTGRVDRMVG